jgi:heme-degrading monooxygenase HmoA
MTMYARLVVASVPPDKLDLAIQLWQDAVLPSVQQQEGFRSVRLLADHENGKIVSLGLWESEADFQATVEWNQGQIARFAGLFTAPPEVSGYEVIVELIKEQ